MKRLNLTAMWSRRYMAGVTGSYDLIFWEPNPGAMDPTSTVSNICSAADPVLGLIGGFVQVKNIKLK